MATPVLTTKLYVPPFRSELVPRPRLIERLDDGLRLAANLTLVSAPAGFGKTTLLSEWVASFEHPVAWVSLDENDNDLVRFFTYVVAALQQVDVRLGRACHVALQAPQPPAVEPFITSLINEIAASGMQVVIVLDDYHVIKLPAIHEAVTFLLDHVPPQLHLVIASRADPSLPLPRLRVRRQITELRAIDLQFSEEETAAFLNQVMKLNLAPEAVAALESRTEGWIAGLQLAALSMESLPDAHKHDFVASLTGDDRYILDYLVEEVLDRQPAHVQTFLLQTSILTRLYGPLCDAVLSDGEEGVVPVSGQEILEYLEHNNLFLVPLDNRRQWYRYHHLFADLLRNQLRASRPDLVPALHRRASAWYAANDLRSEAIDHSLAAEDWGQVVQLIDQVANDVLGGGAYFTDILGWLDALPQEVVRAYPHLGAIRAWMLMLVLQSDAAERCLQEVERAADGPLPDGVRLQITAIRAFLARHRRDVDNALALSHQVLDALAGGASAPNLVRPMVALNLANVYRMVGDVVQAQRWFSEVLSVSEAAGITLTLAVVNGQASAQAVAGKLRQAAETYRRALELAGEAAQQNGGMVPAVSWIHTGLGDLLREWNELDKAADHLAQGLELGRQWQIGMTLCNGYIYMARLRQAQGDIPGALDVIRQAERLPQAFWSAPRYSEPMGACRARLALVQARSCVGDARARHLEVAEQWAQARGLSVDSLRVGDIRIHSLNDECEHLIWARLLIAQGEPGLARQLLAHLQQAAQDGGRSGRVIEILALQALAEQALGDTEGALETLAQALSLAEPEGYVRTFVDEGAPMAALLRALGPLRRFASAPCEKQRAGSPLRSDARRSALRDAPTVSPGYIGKLLDAFGPIGAGEAVPEAAPKPSRSEPLALEALTDREMEVLRLLRTALSGPEIAQELYLSVNTVKTHIKRIYDKLGAHSRYEAVERAGELDLL